MPTSVLNNVRGALDINPAAGALYQQNAQLTATARTVAGGNFQSGTITVGTGDAATTYTITVGDESVSVTGVASNTQIASDLKDALNAKIGISNLLNATVSSTQITLTSRIKGDTFTASSSVSGGGGSIGAYTPVTTASDPTPIFAGRFVEAADYTGVLGSTKGAAVVGSGTYTQQQSTITITTSAASEHIAGAITGDFDGKGVRSFAFSMETNNNDANNATGLKETIEDLMSGVSNSLTITVASNVVTLEAAIAGVSFTVDAAAAVVAAAPSTTVVVSNTAQANAIPRGAGFVRAAAQMEMTAEGVGRFTGGMALTCIEGGELYVELDEGATISLDDPVFVRRVVSGTEVAGACRGSADGTDCVPLSAYGLGGKWLTTHMTGFHGRNVAALRVFSI
jgi:hypothetical protein